MAAALTIEAESTHRRATAYRSCKPSVRVEEDDDDEDDDADIVNIRLDVKAGDVRVEPSSSSLSFL